MLTTLYKSCITRRLNECIPPSYRWWVHVTRLCQSVDDDESVALGILTLLVMHNVKLNGGEDKLLVGAAWKIARVDDPA